MEKHKVGNLRSYDRKGIAEGKDADGSRHGVGMICYIYIVESTLMK